MFRSLTLLPLCAVAAAQEAPSSLENMQRLIESAKPLASTLLRVRVREDLRTAIRLPIPETPAGADLRIGAKLVTLVRVVWWRHFEAAAMQPWVDILEFGTPAAAAKVFNDGRQAHSGMPAAGFFLFLTSAAPAGRSAVCAVVQPQRWLFSVCAAAPFTIDFDQNPAEERRQIAGWVDLVARTLENVVRQAIDPRVVTYVPSASPDPDEVRMLRVAGFARLWSEVRQNFVFLDQRPELDWDAVLERYLPDVIAAKSQAGYIAVLKRVMALLRDGHSGIMALDDRDTPAVRIESIEGKPVVIAVAATAEMEASGVRPGMEVVEVDGRPAAKVIEDEYQYVTASTTQDRDARAFSLVLAGPSGSTAAVRLRGTDGELREARMARNLGSVRRSAPWTQRPPLEFRMLEGGVAYVAANTFGSDAAVKEFDRIFPQILGAKGLIIDVRNNGGGSSDIGFALIARLIDTPVTQTSVWRTRDYRPVYRAWNRPMPLFEGGDSGVVEPRGERPFTGPVAVLIGPNTYSAAEDFLVPLKMSGRAKLVGTATGGSTGQPLIVEVYGAYARICTKWDRMPDGTEFVGVGVQPDVRVEPTRQAIAAGRDVVLERAVQVLSGTR
ncbi:MAG TPA: S41 family peptidase [Candidatus Acidoferrales bacterium]|nr:S41 family peptidase [Candidatus Acidoferrales bacterium]